jgi:hypothetical protein
MLCFNLFGTYWLYYTSIKCDLLDHPIKDMGRCMSIMCETTILKNHPTKVMWKLKL